eukprot:m.220705 g.220705  ORF g.220705 m.220705 type:complete len:1086 (-) comp33326_c0_seq2:351-3608(-)
MMSTRSTMGCKLLVLDRHRVHAPSTVTFVLTLILITHHFQCGQASICGSFSDSSTCASNLPEIGLDNVVQVPATSNTECQKHCEGVGIVDATLRQSKCCAFENGICTAFLAATDGPDAMYTLHNSLSNTGSHATLCQIHGGQKHPHVLFICVDDAGWNDFQWNPGNNFQTPVMEKLASDGVLLKYHYGLPVCAPSRFAFHTGRHPNALGLGDNNIYPTQDIGLPFDAELLPEAFKKRSYRTYGFGKWHQGHATKLYTPTYRGYDYWFGGFLGSKHLFDHTKITRSHTCVIAGNDVRRCNGSSIETITTEAGVHSTTMLTTDVVDVINRHPTEDSAFFFVSYNAPHSPYQAPSELVDVFKESYPGVKERQIVAGMMLGLDKGIAHIITALEQKNMWEDTITVFVSDNGGKFFTTNYPLRGSKGSVWEGGVRTVAFIHTHANAGISHPTLWKGLHPSRLGKVYDGLVHMADWKHTLLDATGVEGPSTPTSINLTLDGLSHWHTLTNGPEVSSPRSEMFIVGIWCHEYSLNVCGAFRSGKWKWVHHHKFLKSDVNDSEMAGTQLSNKPTLFEVDCGAEETGDFECLTKPCLFDLEEDPCERRNVFAENVEVATSLQATFTDLLILGGAALPRTRGTGCGFALNGSWGLWKDYSRGSKQVQDVKTASGCPMAGLDLFDRAEDMRSTQQPFAVRTVQQRISCATNCLATTGCEAFNFATVGDANECHLFNTKETSRTLSRNTSGGYHALIEECHDKCPSSNTTSLYTQIQNTRPRTSTQHFHHSLDNTSPIQCMALCRTLRWCQSFSYRKTDGTCFFYTSRMDGQDLTTLERFDYYLRNLCSESCVDSNDVLTKFIAHPKHRVSNEGSYAWQIVTSSANECASACVAAGSLTCSSFSFFMHVNCDTAKWWSQCTKTSPYQEQCAWANGQCSSVNANRNGQCRLYSNKLSLESLTPNNDINYYTLPQVPCHVEQEFYREFEGQDYVEDEDEWINPEDVWKIPDVDWTMPGVLSLTNNLKNTSVASENTEDIDYLIGIVVGIAFIIVATIVALLWWYCKQQGASDTKHNSSWEVIDPKSKHSVQKIEHSDYI